MKDAQGTPLEIGDKVWTTVVRAYGGNSHRLQLLTITGFGKKMVLFGTGSRITRYPEACIKSSPQVESCSECDAPRVIDPSWACRNCDWEH